MINKYKTETNGRDKILNLMLLLGKQLSAWLADKTKHKRVEQRSVTASQKGEGD